MKEPVFLSDIKKKEKAEVIVFINQLSFLVQKGITLIEFSSLGSVISMNGDNSMMIKEAVLEKGGIQASLDRLKLAQRAGQDIAIDASLGADILALWDEELRKELEAAKES